MARQSPGGPGAGPSRPRAFASWQQKMDGWEAPRREGNRREGEGVERGPGTAVRGPRRHPGRPRAPVAGVEDGVEDGARGCPARALQRGLPSRSLRRMPCAEGGLDWDVYIICVHVSGPEEPCPDSTSWTGMEGGVAPCRAPTRYISPPDEMTHVKASLAVGDAARSAALPRGAHRGPRRPPSKRNLTMSSSNGGRRLPGPSRPRGPSRRAFNGDDGA